MALWPDSQDMRDFITDVDPTLLSDRELVQYVREKLSWIDASQPFDKMPYEHFLKVIESIIDEFLKTRYLAEVRSGIRKGKRKLNIEGGH